MEISVQKDSKTRGISISHDRRLVLKMTSEGGGQKKRICTAECLGTPSRVEQSTGRESSKRKGKRHQEKGGAGLCEKVRGFERGGGDSGDAVQTPQAEYTLCGL